MSDLFEFKHHIFDLDDTLVNTRFSYKYAQSKALLQQFPDLSQKKRSEYIDELYWFSQAMGSGNVEQYFTAFLKNRGIPEANLTKVCKQLIQEYERTYWKQLIALNRANEYLQTLLSKQKILTLVSNGKVASQTKKLELTKLSFFFRKKNSFISEEFQQNQKKPSPYMLMLACKQLKVVPDHSVFYGNSVSDILAGNLAGVYTVFIRRDDSIDFSKLPFIAHPSRIINEWGDLL